MTANILCQTCGEIMGELTKDNITQDDITLYQQMMTCSKGHHVSTLDVTDDGSGDDPGSPDDPGDPVPDPGL